MNRLRLTASNLIDRLTNRSALNAARAAAQAFSDQAAMLRTENYDLQNEVANLRGWMMVSYNLFKSAMAAAHTKSQMAQEQQVARITQLYGNTQKLNRRIQAYDRVLRRQKTKIFGLTCNAASDSCHIDSLLQIIEKQKQEIIQARVEIDRKETVIQNYQAGYYHQ